MSDLYGQVLPSSDRGMGLALEVVCLEILERGQEAQNLIADVMKEEGDDHVFVLAAGIEFADLEFYAHAEIFLRNLCELDPDNHLGWFNLAITLGRESRYPESIKAYEECIRCDPTFPDAYLQKGYCEEMMGDLEQAAATYRHCLESTAEEPEAWKALGIVESDRRNYEASCEAFAQAEKLGADPVDIYFNWAISATRNNDIQKLEVCIEKLQAVDPEGWRTLLTRADYEETQQGAWAAWELLTEALEAALEEEGDVEARGYVAGSLLRFAKRNEMEVHVEEHVKRIFKEELFTEDVLEALMTLENRLSNAASSHQVVLETDGGESDRLYVVYGVSAENPEQARDIAMEFQQRCREDVWKVYSLQEISGRDEGPLGVYWRSPEADTPPGAHPATAQ